MPELGESIILTHWGLVRPEIGCSWVERLQIFGHCLEREDPTLTDPRQSMPCYALPPSRRASSELGQVAERGRSGSLQGRLPE